MEAALSQIIPIFKFKYSVQLVHRAPSYLAEAGHGAMRHSSKHNIPPLRRARVAVVLPAERTIMLSTNFALNHTTASRACLPLSEPPPPPPPFLFISPPSLLES